MEKRLAIALILSIAFMAVWWTIFPPPSRPSVPPNGEQAEGAGSGVAAGDGPAAAGPGETVADGERATPAAMTGPAAPTGESVSAEAEETIEVETPLYTARFTNRGARVTSWRLNRYLDDHGEPLELVSAAGRKLDLLPLQLALDDEQASRALGHGLYRFSRSEAPGGEGAPVSTIVFRYADVAGNSAIKTIRLPHDSYLATLEVSAHEAGHPATPAVIWGAGFGTHTGLETDRFEDAAGAVVEVAGKVETRGQQQVKPDAPWTTGGTISWAGVTDKYFAAVLIPDTPASGQARLESLRLVEEGREKFFPSLTLNLPETSQYELFVGPKDYDILKTAGHGLDRLLNFGFFSVVALPLFYALKFVNDYTRNFGWAIVLLTVAIRLLFFPLMHRSQVGMRKMQEKMKVVNPRVKALRERYRKLERKEVEKGTGRRHQVRQKMNEEMMGIYKEAGINPMGQLTGCLPLLLQMPILYGFYTILSIAIELRKAPFLFWVQDLSRKDPYFITPIIMGVTMLIQQMMTSSSIPDPAQRRIMYIMPVMFTYFFVHFPSGLVLYWLVNNLLGIAQQYLINRHVAAESNAA